MDYYSNVGSETESWLRGIAARVSREGAVYPRPTPHPRGITPERRRLMDTQPLESYFTRQGMMRHQSARVVGPAPEGLRVVDDRTTFERTGVPTRLVVRDVHDVVR